MSMSIMAPVPCGTCALFMLSEPLAGQRHVMVRERRTAHADAAVLQYLCDEVYSEAEQIVLAGALWAGTISTHTVHTACIRRLHQRRRAASTTDLSGIPHPSMVSQAWFLAQHGGDRVECLSTSMLEGTHGASGLLTTAGGSLAATTKCRCC
jgi:hypothetical protein